MSGRVGLAGLLLASIFWLAGCALWQGAGPCYGVGCHAGLLSSPARPSAQAAPAKQARTNPFAFLFRRRAVEANAPQNGLTNAATRPSPAISAAAPDQGH